MQHSKSGVLKQKLCSALEELCQPPREMSKYATPRHGYDGGTPGHVTMHRFMHSWQCHGVVWPTYATQVAESACEMHRRVSPAHHQSQAAHHRWVLPLQHQRWVPANQYCKPRCWRKPDSFCRRTPGCTAPETLASPLRFRTPRQSPTPTLSLCRCCPLRQLPARCPRPLVGWHARPTHQSQRCWRERAVAGAQPTPPRCRKQAETAHHLPQTSRTMRSRKLPPGP